MEIKQFILNISSNELPKIADFLKGYISNLACGIATSLQTS